MPEDIVKDVSIVDAAPEDISETIEDAWNESYQTEATSFSQLESSLSLGDISQDVFYLTSTFRNLLNNVISNESITDKISAIKNLAKEFSDRMDALISAYDQSATQSAEQKSLFDKTKEMFAGFFKEQTFKTDGGMKFHASDYAYVPDKTKPSTWKIRLTEKPGAAPTKAQLGRAAAAMSSGGFMGNQAKIPSSAKAAVKAKIRAAYRKLGVKDSEIPDAVKEKHGLMIIKEADGRYRWFAQYSNAYRDDDNPSEILKESAHERFVSLVDEGKVPMPELWHWHVPGSQWGQADLVWYDKENKVSNASGYVLPGHEQEAEALMNADDDIAVSHGMPPDSVVRDSVDKSLIGGYVTREISDLPLWAAANKLTSFCLMKEQPMAIPDAKKQYLKQHGVTDEQLALIEGANTSIAKEAAETGRETKEAKTEPVTPVADPTPEAKPIDATKEDASKAKPGETPATPETSQPATAETTKETTEPVAETITPADFKQLKESVAALSVVMAEVLKGMNTTEPAAENKETTPDPLMPPASAAAFVAKQLSVIGKPEAKVDGRASLAKDGPEETKETKPSIVRTPNPLLDAVLTNIVGGKYKPEQED